MNHNKTAKEMNRVILETNSQCHDNCSICLSSLKNKIVAHLPCGHTFHHSCLMKQFKSSHNSATRCAMCRTDFLESMPEKAKTWKINVNSYRILFRQYEAAHLMANVPVPTRDSDIIRDIVSLRHRLRNIITPTSGIVELSNISNNITITLNNHGGFNNRIEIPFYSRTQGFIDIPNVQENV